MAQGHVNINIKVEWNNTKKSIVDTADILIGHTKDKTRKIDSIQNAKLQSVERNPQEWDQ